jgi:hypothetical protein
VARNQYVLAHAVREGKTDEWHEKNYGREEQRTENKRIEKEK